jgi:hypothetical protein
MMPTCFRHVKYFFRLLFGSIFCSITKAVLGDKEVSSEVIFTTWRPVFHGSRSVLSLETERSHPLNPEKFTAGSMLWRHLSRVLCGFILVFLVNESARVVSHFWAKFSEEFS